MKKKLKKIAVVTATRAEYGLLIPLIKRINEDNELILDLIVTGMHLSKKYGYTADAIRDAKFPVSCEIPILEDGNTPFDISLTMANAVKGFAQRFREDRPDMVVILGDRTEMLGVAFAAMNERIPIAHIYGGEVTAGAVDDSVRHAITKMSYLHFTSAKAYRHRVIQLGEEPERVFNVGALGVENILTQNLLGGKEIRNQMGIPDGMEFAVVTFHPETLEECSTSKQVEELMGAMEDFDNIFFLITAANADSGGEEVNRLLQEFSRIHENSRFVYNLGMKRYLSAVKNASFVLGNSSSGILEAPVLGTPTVNVGDRQKGRLMAETIVNCETEREKIIESIRQARFMERISTDIYGNGTASIQIVDIMKEYLMKGRIDLKKGFYDIEVSLP